MGGVCPACFKRLTFIGDPHCARCGLPFDYDPGAGSLCGACISDAPLFDRARAALAYDDGSRAILIGLKHNRAAQRRDPGRLDAAQRAGFGRGRRSDLCRAAASLAADAARLQPGRRYWRAASQGTSRRGLSPICCTASAAPSARADCRAAAGCATWRGAFAVSPRWQARIKGKRVLLIDDVFTTGATIGECCRVLKRAGAAHVDVLCAARVIK